MLAEIGSDKAVLHIEDLSVRRCTAAPGRCWPSKDLDELDAVVNNAAMVVSSNIHTTDITFFQACLEDKYPCAVHADQSCASAFAGIARMRAQHWFRQRIQWRTESICLTVFQKAR